MRVAVVCPYAWDRPGGVQSHIRALAAALRGRDHDVIIIAPSAGEPPKEDGVVHVGHAVGIPANGSVAPLAFGPLVAARVRRAMESFRPDVLHLHEPLIPSVSLLTLWAAGSIPCVGTFHAAATSSAGYGLARPVLDRAARRLTVRTAVSESARELATRYFPGSYLLTPNGVDVERFDTAEPLRLGPDKKILFFGRIERRKGLEVLIQAMTRLRDLHTTVVVGGTGPEEKHCRRLAGGLQIETRFLGRVPEEDVPRLYRSVDVYCAPGLGGESFGIVLLEAMAAGTPVVCSDLPGFRDATGDAAALVSPGDAGALADALRRVLNTDADDLARKGANRSRAFDWKRLVGGVEMVYERALSDAAATVD